MLTEVLPYVIILVVLFVALQHNFMLKLVARSAAALALLPSRATGVFAFQMSAAGGSAARVGGALNVLGTPLQVSGNEHSTPAVDNYEYNPRINCNAPGSQSSL